WIKDHYLLESKHFTFKRSELGPDEVADYDKLVAFVATFPANLWEDSDGNLLMGTDGRPKTTAKLIDTKKLLG
ncbi:hypothetical protein A2U01_0100021, partial [Trifolium medium]|nr:hypothetical protein [Trifolium medium]